jgi:uncharacterized damage-inducible protein DinB
MNLEDLRLLIDFHYWARDRVLDAVAALTPEQFTRSLGGSFGSVRDTLTHLYSAEWVWVSRWTGSAPTVHISPDTFPDVNTLRVAWKDHEGKMRSLLDALGEEGVARSVEYRLFSGAIMTEVTWRMLQHVVNHATYHRGQVTTMLRQLGASPAESQDLITFYREIKG